MANITTLNTAAATGSAVGHATRRGKKVPYAITNRITGAAAKAANGDVGLAAADTVEAIAIPANTMLIEAWLNVITADTGTTLTFDLGQTGGDVDKWVDGADGTTAGLAAVTVTASGTAFPTADNIDLLVATESAANDDWIVEVGALVLDATAVPVPDKAKPDLV